MPKKTIVSVARRIQQNLDNRFSKLESKVSFLAKEVAQLKARKK